MANRDHRNGGQDGHCENPTSRKDLSWSKRLRHNHASYPDRLAGVPHANSLNRSIIVVN
jgi:hypothetical protein